MNEYKITFKYPEGAEETARIIERTEKAAQKQLTRRYGGVEIIDTELIDANAAATKEQERETLEKIRAMVAELGPHSYLATSFDGVFEDAEQNIEFDAAFSMKGRVETAEAKAKELGSQYNALKRDMNLLQGQIAAAQEQIVALTAQQLPEKLRRDLWVMVTDEAEASRARMAEAADKMAAGADNPGCVLFKDSVALYRTEKARAEVMEQRAAELDALEPKEK